MKILTLVLSMFLATIFCRAQDVTHTKAFIETQKVADELHAVKISSRVEASLLTKKVEPKYSFIGEVRGAVVLRAVIDKDGNVRSVAAISGPEMWLKPAAEAVLQWKYQAFLLNGERVAVDTTIVLGSSSAR